MNKQHRASLGLNSFLIILLWLPLGIGFLLYNTDIIFSQEVTKEKNNPVADNYLHQEEVILVNSNNGTTSSEILPIETTLFEYVEVIDGCDVNFEGECVNVRSGPGTDYAVVSQLRNNIILKVNGMVERDGLVWYKIVFDEFIRYPERVTTDWYIAADYVEILYDEGEKTVWDENGLSTPEAAAKLQRIVVDRSEQKLYAYEDDVLFIEAAISTGLELTPTPRGEFTVFKKTPSRYMQGPLPYLAVSKYYDLPGVPWNLYFTEGGAVIHGAYWHKSFGSQYSSGCVNLPPDTARDLYHWAKLGTKVIVRD